MFLTFSHRASRFIGLMVLLFFVGSSFSPYAFALENEVAFEKEEMDFIKEDIRYTYDKLNERVQLMERNDPKRDRAKDLLDDVKEAVDELGNASESDFEELEKSARDAINTLNRFFIEPFRRPGVSDTGEGGVPEGDIITDFIPQAIRLLFRFASLAVLVSFVVSGVMFIISFDNEERVTKAKQMLYFTFLGFAFVTLAFAIVKALTDIDFFGFF